MILDARNLPNDTTLEADLCIIGAGAAGITLARHLANTSLQLCVLESGRFDLEDETQALYHGEIVGTPYASLVSTRLRQFGGTTNHWAGWCRPLDPIDFEVRPWLPHSGWPITREELTPYYALAQEACELAAHDYDPQSWQSDPATLLELTGSDLESIVWQYSPPTRFGERYRAELERAENLQLVLGANLIEFDGASGGRHLTHAQATTLEGTRFRVRARAFALACGGIENARLLLNCRSLAPQGLGNEHDLVGRFFMEHPHAVTGQAFLMSGVTDASFYTSRNSPPLRLDQRVGLRLRALFGLDTTLPRARGGLRLTAAAQHSHSTLNTSIVLSEIDELDAVGQDLAQLTGAAGIDEAFTRLRMRVQQEQAPNPDSRVFLGEDTDTLGMRRVVLDWRLSDIDWHTLVTTQHAIARALGMNELGRASMDAWLIDDPDSWEGLYGGNHHMGTTRMSDDPTQGVVDADCRVHSVANLYIAGSSVFPTGGAANPTLTIVALAYRLADHLKRIL